MIPALFPDQEIFVQQIRASLAAHQRIIACAATGFGKTYTFIHIALAALERGRTVLILSESKKIYKQIKKALPHTRNINADNKGIPIITGHCYLAMAQTLSRRKYMLEIFKNMGANLFCITDEAHIGTHSKILEAIPLAYLIGFTATPNYKDAKHLPRIYHNIVVGPQPFELVQAGRLSPYRHWQRQQANLEGLELLSTGDFSAESQERAFETPKVYDGLFQDLHTTKFKKAIIYCASIKHAEDVTTQLRSNGFRCVCIHSKSQDLDAKLECFTHGTIPICVSVGMLTKGFDEPEIDLVILQRATTSLALYLQMMGRGSRKHPGKTGFTVLDYGGNGSRHHPWDWERDWKTLWNTAPKKRESIAPIKICPDCDELLPASIRTCPGCGHVFEVAASAPVQESTLVEITGAYQPLIGKMLSELPAPDLAIYAKLKNKKAHAIRVAKRQEQLQPGFLRIFGDSMGYKPGWALYQVKELSTEPIEFYDIKLK